MNPVGYDDMIWDPPETWADLGFSGPSFGMGVLLVVCVLGGILFAAPVILKEGRRRRDGYKRVRSARADPEYDA